MLRRTGAAAPPFGVPQNRPMPFRVPGTHAGRRAPTEVASDSGKVPRQRGRRQHEVPPLRQRGIGKTSADKTSTRRPPENISKTSRRRHENHQQRRGCAGETRALAAKELPVVSPPHRDDPLHTSLLRHASLPSKRISPAREPPRARKTSAKRHLFIGQTARGKPGGPLKTQRAPKAF